MSVGLTEEIILDALRAVSHEGASLDLVKAGIVSGIVIKDGHISFSLEVAPEEADSIQPLRIAAENTVASIKGVLSASAILTAHKKDQAPSNQPSSQQSPMHQPATHVIAVASGKGGVGKSTTALNLAQAIRAMGKTVGVLDADIYGPSLPRLTGVTTKPETRDNKLIPITAHGLKVMSLGFLLDEDTPTIWRGPMVMSALEQMLRDVAWQDDDGKMLDMLVIDMPPGTGDAQLTLSQRAKLSGAVIVSTPQDLALIDARKGLNMFHKVGVPVLGLVENMSFFTCPSCQTEHHIFGHGGAESEAKKLGLPFLGKIPLEIAIRANADSGTPIVVSEPDSPHSLAYHEIAKAVMENLGTEKAAPTITIN